VANFTRKNLYSEKSLGDKLVLFRKKKHLSLEQAEEETKVRLKYLLALEKGNYETLPADVYALGFLAKYADFLEAPKEELLGDFKRERGISRQANPISVQTGPKREKFLITPKVIMILVGILAGIGLVVYIFYSIKNFTNPPNLEISSPVAETVIRQSEVEVIGKTDEGCSLQINGQTIFLDENGNFKEKVSLQPGINNIEIRSQSRIQKETVKNIKILAEF